MFPGEEEAKQQKRAQTSEEDVPVNFSGRDSNYYPSSTSSSSSSSSSSSGAFSSKRKEKMEKKEKRKSEAVDSQSGTDSDIDDDKLHPNRTPYFEIEGEGNDAIIIAEDLVCSGRDNRFTAIQAQALSREGTERVTEKAIESSSDGKQIIIANKVSIRNSGSNSDPQLEERQLIERLAAHYSKQFDPRMGDIYIPPFVANSEKPGDKASPSLMDASAGQKGKLDEFLEGDERSLLLLGQPGMGKTYFSSRYCQAVWQQIKNNPEHPLPRLPLYVYLPKYNNYLHQEKRSIKKGKRTKGQLIEKILEDMRFSDAECKIIMAKPLLIILDGFDEITFRDNIYEMQGWGDSGYDIRMLITCRPEAFLELQRSLSSLFEASNLSGHQPVYYQRLYLQPFNEVQVEDYFNQHFRAKPKEGERYYKQLMQVPSLRELVTTPFLLWMAINILPRIEALPKDDSIRQHHFTQTTLFKCFLGESNDNEKNLKSGWFFKQAQRVKAKKTPPSNSGTPELTLSNEEVSYYMYVYAENLAVSLLDSSSQQLDEGLLDNERTLRPDFIEPLLYEDHRQLFFKMEESGRREEEIKQIPNDNFCAIRSGCLLHVYGHVDNLGGRFKTDEFKFLHKSVTEYLVAQKLAKELLANQNDLVTWLTQEERGLNRILLTKEPEIIARLAEMANETDEPLDFSNWQPKQAEGGKQLSLKQLLFNILMASKGKPDLSIAAANAITVLNMAMVSFSCWDLKKVSISGANLSGSICHRTEFDEADLSNVLFKNAFLQDASFKKATMTAVQFGEYPSVRFHRAAYNQNILLAYSPKENLLAASFDYHVYLFFGGYPISEDNSQNIQALDLKNKAKALCISFGVKSESVYLACGHTSGLTIWQVGKESQSDLVRQTQVAYQISSVEFSSDGNYLFCGTNQGEIEVYKNNESSESIGKSWQELTTKHKFDFNSHNCLVKSLSFSPIHKKLACIVWSGDNLATDYSGLRNRFDKNTLQEFEKTIFFLNFSDDEQSLSLDQNTECINKEVEGVWGLICLAFSPNGKYLVVGAYPHNPNWCTLFVFDTENNWEASSFPSEGATVAIAFSPDSKQLVSADFSQDYRVKLWDMRTRQKVVTLGGHHNVLSDVLFVVNSEERLQVVSAAFDCSMSLHDCVYSQSADTIIVTRSRLGSHSGWVFSLSFSHDNKYLVSGSFNDNFPMSIWEWNGFSGQIVKTFSAEKFEGCQRIRSVSFHPLGQDLGIADDKGNIWLLNISGNSTDKLNFADKLQKFECCPPQAVENKDTAEEEPKPLTSLSFSSCGKYLFSGSDDGFVYILNLVSKGKQPKAFHAHSGGVSSVCSGSCNNIYKEDLFASVGKEGVEKDQGVEVKIWDVHGKEKGKYQLPGYCQNPRNISFTSFGLVIGCEYKNENELGALLCELRYNSDKVESPQKITNDTEYKGKFIKSLAFCSEKNYLAVGLHDFCATLNHRIEIWEVQPKKMTLKHTIDNAHQVRVSSLAFSSDGKYLASGGGDHEVRIWALICANNNQSEPVYKLLWSTHASTKLQMTRTNFNECDKLPEINRALLNSNELSLACSNHVKGEVNCKSCLSLFFSSASNLNDDNNSLERSPQIDAATYCNV